MGDKSNSMRRRKKFNPGKGELTPVSASAKSGSVRLRRSSRGITSREQNTPTSSASETKAEKDSSRVHNDTRKSTRLKRKSEVLEREKVVSSPLRKSDKGKKQSSLASSDSNSNGNVIASANFNRIELRREKSVKQLTLEAMETSTNEKEVKRSNGKIKKKLTRRTNEALSKKKLRRDTVPDLEEPNRPEKLSQDGLSCFEDEQSNPVEAGDDHGLFESSRLNSKCGSGDALGDCSQENCVNVSKESSACEDVNLLPWHASDLDKEPERPKKLQVNYALVVELQSPEVEILPNSQIAEGTDVIPFSSSKSGKDSIVGTCASCCKMQSPEVEILPDSQVAEGTDVLPFSSSKTGKDSIVGTCASCCKMRRLDYDSPTQELCSCSRGMNSDLSGTSIFEDTMELARCDNSLDNGDLSTCAICKLDGKLLRCDGKGCKKSYHFSCLDVPLGDGLLGVLHCFSCVMKKIEYGAHSVSAGVEAILDAREVGDKGVQRQRQFLVKYKGLAHIHNQWLSEAQLLHEAPMVVSKFDEQKQDSKWRQEWTVPHRLLKKRVLWFPEDSDNSHIDTSNCQYEWLVKWCGLDYEHATWELENPSFVHSSQVQNLIKEFENRHKRAKIAASSSSPEKSKKQAIVKLPKVRAGCSSADEHNQLISVNKLIEFWSKGQNAIVVDDQERIANVILFITSLISDVTRPFLIISSPNVISIWESEFSRLAPFINVIVYSGNQDSKKIIRTCEIYADRGRTMLQVLLSSVEAVIEDIEVLLPWWEAIIVDECQDIEISKHFEQIRKLRIAVRILLFNGQLKENTAEHLNVLSLLDSPENLVAINGLECCQLMEKLSPFIAYNCRTDSSRFVEYWVPVSTSNVQLEQYCSTLLSNYTTLRASGSKDIVGGALHDILISMKKCCDHPYSVDLGLQGFLTKDLPPVEYLDVGIKASGKLQLLDIVLSKIKNRGKRVLILYQFSTGMLTGDILDDFLRQRFGSDSYERVDKGILPSKKQAALNKFNDKGSGRFVFLLEKRACSATFKLTSVDAVVIYDSDWHLMNDNRAVQKLSFDSSLEPIKIFRLYTCCTMEEKVLDLAANNTTLDSTMQNICRTTSHLLLMWGASYLFNKLDAFHGRNASKSGIKLHSDISMLQDVSKELLNLVTKNAENPPKTPLITKVQCVGSTYSKSSPLFGRSVVEPSDGKIPHLFWNELLEGKNPRWKFLSGYSHRNRKRVQFLDAQPENPGGGPDNVSKKQKIITKNSSGAASPRTKCREGASEVLPPKSPTLFSSDNTLPAFEFPTADMENRIKLHDEQKHHGDLKSAILELSETLLLPEHVKTMGEIFLEYIIDNHKIHSEPSTTLQAFQISLVWIVASLLRYKIDKNNSLDVAKKLMGFHCTEEEVISVHSKLRILQKKFKETSEKFKEFKPPKYFSDDNREHVLKKCRKRKTRLLRKHGEEIEDFNKTWEERRTEIEKQHKIEQVVVRTIHLYNEAVRSENLKRVDEVYARKMEEHTQEKELRLQDLREKQLKEITEEDQKADSWLKKITDSGQEQSTALSKKLVPSGNKVSNGQDNNDTNLSDSIPADNNNNTSGNSRHDGNVSKEKPRMDISPAEKISKTLAQDVLPQNFDESPRSTTSARIHDGDAAGCENTTKVLEKAETELLPLTNGVELQADFCDASTHSNEINSVTDRIEGGRTLAPPNSESTEHHLSRVELSPSQQGEQSIMQSRGNLHHDATCHPRQINFGAQFLDPLQIELDRLRRETEEAIKLHDDAKSQLKSEYDEEVKAVLAELHRKYQTKLKSAEAEFLMKKKELDDHQNKVFMNKMVAEAFRTKNEVVKSSGSSRKCEVPSTNFLQQLLIQSSQHRYGSLNLDPPVANQQRAAPSVPAPPRPSPTITNMQMRQPCTLPIRNILSSGEVRAPAPHLRPSLPVRNPTRGSHFSTVPRVPPGFSTPMPPQHLGTNFVDLYLSQGGKQGGHKANGGV